MHSSPLRTEPADRWGDERREELLHTLSCMCGVKNGLNTRPTRLKSFQYVDEIQIAPNLYYLNGAEGIMSLLEVSCRIGKNVASNVTSRFVV